MPRPIRFSTLAELRAFLGKEAARWLSAVGCDLNACADKDKKTHARRPTPHDILWEALRRRFPDAVREMRGAVPGRRFRLDIAIPEAKLAIEVDGWQWHGRHKGDFARDRERQNLLTLHGWRILRFSAGQIIMDLEGCVEQVRMAAVQAGTEKTCR